MSSLGLKHPRCPFCHEDVKPGDAKVACDGCMSWHHRACWADHGRCSSCGTQEGLSVGAPVERSAAPAANAHAIQAAMERNLRALQENPLGITIRRTNAELACPRCGLDLREVDYEQTPVHLCEQCWGYWLSHTAFRRVLLVREEKFSRRERKAVGPLRGLEIIDPPTCPECGRETEAIKVGAPVWVFACEPHGAWTDTGELKRVQVLAERNGELLASLLLTLRAEPL